MHRDERGLVGADARLLVDDGAEPFLGDLTLAVGELLEAVEAPGEVFVLELDSHLGHGIGERSAP